jgi:AcrR family transcriptional regulator
MVARSLGLTDPAVHYYFPSKQSLYLALLSQPDYGPLPLDSASLTRESVIDQAMHLFAWWVERQEFGQMLLREQLASEEASVAYLTSSDTAWDEHVSAPLRQLLGPQGEEVADAIADMLSGLYWEAVLTYGETTREIASQPYFQDRLRRMLELAVPEPKVSL